MVSKSLTSPYLLYTYDAKEWGSKGTQKHGVRGSLKKKIMIWSQDKVSSNGFHRKLSEAYLEVFHSSKRSKRWVQKDFKWHMMGVSTVI